MSSAWSHQGDRFKSDKAEVKLLNSPQDTYQPCWLPPFKGAGLLGNTTYKKLKVLFQKLEWFYLFKVYFEEPPESRISRFSLWALRVFEGQPISSNIKLHRSNSSEQWRKWLWIPYQPSWAFLVWPIQVGSGLGCMCLLPSLINTIHELI